MVLDPIKLYTSNERKKIIERLKGSKDLGWFTELIKRSTGSQLLYLSEPLTECFKSNKLTLDASLVQLIVQSLDRNCQNILTNVQCSCSLEEVAFLSVCCLGLHLFLKSKLSDTFDISLLNTTSEQLMEFLLVAKQFPRDALKLVVLLVIFINVKYHNISPKAQHEFGIQFFSGDQYLLALWENCLLKTCKFGESDQDVMLMMLQDSVKKVRENVVWYQFVYLDTIRTCLKKHRSCCSELKEVVPEIFDLVTLFCDDHGLNVSKVCEDIVQTCLEIEPGLIQTVQDISLGPWYSRKTISFLNLFLSKSKSIMETSIVSSMLKSLVSHLGYNRLDHCSLKAIQTLLDRNMSKENFVTLLKICVSCVDVNPVISRILSRYVYPFYTKQEIFPDDLKEHVFKIIDCRDTSDQGRIFLFEIFYSCFKQDLLQKLLSSQLNKSSSSEVQSALIMLISRNVKDFFENDFVVATYENLLTIPCPTVRVHAIASFQSLKPLAKSNNPSMTLLIGLFLKNTYMEAPYHSVLTALNFFITLQSNIDTKFLTDLQRDTMREQIIELINHTDTEISSLAKRIEKHFYLQKKSNEYCIKDSTDLFTSFMDEIEKVTGLQNISQTDIPSKVSPLKSELSNMSTQNIVAITRISVALINNLLDMISHSSSGSEQFYSAPSFEETFVIIQSAVDGNETFCKNAGKSVWSAIAGLLDLLSIACGVLVDSTMEGYMIDGETFVADLYSIGDMCLKCVFRCRHRSIINASCETLKVISVKTSPHPPTHELPSRWVHNLLHVLYSPTSSSLSRRSAGLPEAIEAVLHCNTVHLTHETVTKLLVTANIPYPEQCAETEDLVQVHSLHMLRVVLSSAKLRHHLIPFSDQICKLCYTGFIHSFWVVRNASFLLFAELVNYILGHLNSEFDCGYRSNLSIGELRQHYSGIYEQVLSNLQEHSSGTKTCPTIFLSLMISSKLYPDIRDGDSILGEYVYKLLSSPIYKIRSVAARTVVLVCPQHRLRELVRGSVEELDSSSHNRVNGVLMFVLESCKCEGNLVESDVIESMSEILRIEKLLDVNISLVLQIYVTLRRKDVLSNVAIDKVLEINEHSHSKGYPSNILDYLGVWFIVSKDYRSAFAHIHSHCSHLSETFWGNLDDAFYRNVTFNGLIWLLDALANKESHYVCDYLANCIFEIVNQHSIADLTIPEHILKFLSDNAEKYAHICMLLAVSYNISTNDSSLLKTLDHNLRFDTSNPKLLSYVYKIENCSHNITLTSELLASALLHCQSENEEVRQLATTFCVLLSTGVSNVHVTARHAMECGVEYVKHLSDVEGQKVCINAIRKVREKVLSEDDGGFDIYSNAHFDKRLFLRLVDV